MLNIQDKELDEELELEAEIELEEETVLEDDIELEAPMTPITMTGVELDWLYKFTQSVGASLIFDLNVLKRRTGSGRIGR